METGFVHLFKIFRLISCNEIGPGEYFWYKYLGRTQNSPESPKSGRSTAHIMNPPTLRQLQRGTRGISRYCLPESSHRNLPAARQQFMVAPLKGIVEERYVGCIDFDCNINCIHDSTDITDYFSTNAKQQG